MARQTPIKETAIFLKEALSDPRTIGAIVPSSRRLARVIAAWIPLNTNEFVLELGPGTGAVTQALLARGVAPDRLIAIEKSPKMVEHMRKHFPKIRVIEGDACKLKALIEQHFRHVPPFSHVVSGLPLLNFPPKISEQIARGIHAVMADHGQLVQFSYHLGPNNTGALKLFRRVNSRLVWLNIPPARVSVYNK